MNTSKCYQLLLLFDKKDLNSFEDFVKSPFFNKNDTVILLYQWLKKHLEHPIRKHKAVHAYDAFRHIFPDKEIPQNTLDKKSAQALNVVLNKLTELATKFIQWKKLETKDTYKQHLVLEEFLNKRAVKLFELHFNKYTKNKDNFQYISPQAYYENFLLEYDYSRWNLLRKDNLHKNNNLQTVSNDLTVYYLTTQLQMAYEMLTFKYLYKISYNLETLPYLLEMAELPPFRDVPLVQIFLTAIRLVKEDDPVYMERLKHLLATYGSNIARYIENDMYILATNFCTIRIIAGESNYLEELFSLYQTMSAKNLLTEGEYIPIDKMKNVISVGCKLKHFEWTKELIEQNQERIAPALRESVYHFGMGAIHFYQNDLKTAVSHFIRVEDIGINYTIDGKFLMMKAYYDLDEDFSERTERILLSFMAFIKQNRIISAVNKQGYINFTKTLHSLYRIKHNVGRRSLEYVENRLNNYKRTNDKKWLLEKIEVLKC